MRRLWINQPYSIKRRRDCMTFHPSIDLTVPTISPKTFYLAGLIPVCSLGMSQIGRMNLGKDASTFKYYTMCGLQEGFEPFAVNMNREITMWFSKRLPTFVNISQEHMHVEVTGLSSAG